MKYQSVGAVIAAASKKTAVPLLQVGITPIISRIVMTLQQADVFPIVIVTGTEELEVVHQLAKFGVIFLKNEDCDQPELFASAKIGLSFLREKCDRIIFTPVNTPMFKPETVRTIMDQPADIVIPSYEGRGGHPIAFRKEAVDDILAYTGDGGLRGAMAAMPERRQWVSVEDDGILVNAHAPDELEQQLSAHNHAILRPNIKVGIAKENVFYDARLKLLMFLIADMGSVKQAYDHMGLSCQKAWDMINQLETEVGYRVVERQHGGKRGGRTTLTERGRRLMYAYQQFERELSEFAGKSFDRIFRDEGLV